MPAAVTPSGVRDGDPAALAGLCAARGPSVLAYCRHVAGDADAGDAAADAFASFRRAVVETSDPNELNPEALLINATRTAAARHVPREGALGVCAAVPLLLAARAEKTISSTDRETLERHLETCWTCRAPVARFKAAERAYREPSDPAMQPQIVTQIIAAMAEAIPARVADPPSNGGTQAAPAAGVLPPAAKQAGSVAAPREQPTTKHRAGDGRGPDRTARERAAAAAAGETPGPRTERERERAAAAAAGETPGPRTARERERAAAAAAAGGSRSPRTARGRAAAAGAAGASRNPRTARERGATPAAGSIPRTARTPAPGPAAPLIHTARGRAGLRARKLPPLTIALPSAVVLVALIVALAVAGVFGGNDPASSPRVAAPSDAPAERAPADVVVVRGAESASADEVERAKARDRARDRARAERKRKAAAKPAKKKRATPPPAAATPGPAATAPPPAPPPPPPPPPPPVAAKPKSSDSAGRSRKVDAGKGATGAEQIPAGEDSSTVPDLAPAPEPATNP